MSLGSVLAVIPFIAIILVFPLIFAAIFIVAGLASASQPYWQRVTAVAVGILVALASLVAGIWISSALISQCTNEGGALRFEMVEPHGGAPTTDNFHLRCHAADGTVLPLDSTFFRTNWRI